MTNDEGLMTKECQMTNDEARILRTRRQMQIKECRLSNEGTPCQRRRPFGLRHSSFLRHLAFVIRHSLVILLAGCAVGPNYKRPTVDSPPNYRFATTLTTNSLADLPWWQVFEDPVLQELIHTAVTNNYDLKQAVARVEQARQQVIVTRSPLFPQIGYNGTAGRGRNALFNSPAGIEGRTETSGLMTLNVAWEIDIW